MDALGTEIFAGIVVVAIVGFFGWLLRRRAQQFRSRPTLPTIEVAPGVHITSESIVNTGTIEAIGPDAVATIITNELDNSGEIRSGHTDDGLG